MGPQICQGWSVCWTPRPKSPEGAPSTLRGPLFPGGVTEVPGFFTSEFLMRWKAFGSCQPSSAEREEEKLLPGQTGHNPWAGHARARGRERDPPPL